MGILVRQGILARHVLPPKGAPRTESDDLSHTLWHSTRWLHVLVELGRGADTLHAQVTYGVSAQPALNRTFWDHATPYVARHRAAPQLVGAHFNFDLNCPPRAPPSILESLLTRRLEDADLELATALGRGPLCSYHGPEGTRPSRIDGLLMDTRLVALLHAAEWLPQGAISGHTPVRFDIHLKGASQGVINFGRPKPLVTAQLEGHEQLLVQRPLDQMEAGWQAALAIGDVDCAWAFWTTTAEESLVALACPDVTPDTLLAGATLPLAPPHLPRGRGTDQLLQEVRLCPKQRPGTGGPLTCPVARVQAAQGPLREVLRWLRRPAQGPGVLPRAVQRAWTPLRHRLGRLRALGPEYTDFESGGVPDRLAPLASLRRLSAAMARRVWATLWAEDKDRVREWREWLEESWSSERGPCIAGSRTSPTPPPVTFLTRPDGTAPASLAEMDGLLQDAWRPINRKYATDPEPDPLAFLRRYGHHVRRVPMLATQLDGPRLRKGLPRMKPSALGLDGWSLGDLRSLPERVLGWLADLLREVERRGKWPARLAEGYTALIPKEGPPGPLNTCPLTVLSMVYRLWAGMRLVDAIAWQEAWAHPAAFGFRPARSALDGAAVTQVLLELCRLRGWAVAGMSIDYVKCFDLIPQAVVLALAMDLDPDPGALPSLKDAGPGYAALGSSGYADDTQAVALGAAALQDTVPTTEEWLRGTGEGRPRGQVLHLGPGGARRPGGADPGGKHPTGGDFPPARHRRRHWGLQGGRCCPGACRRDGAPCATRPISRPLAGGSGPQHPGHPAGPPWSGGSVGDGSRPAGVQNRGGAGLVGAGARIPGQGGHIHRAVQGAARTAGAGDQPGHGDPLFPEQPRPRPRSPYTWDAFVGPIPGDAVRHQPRLHPGVPSDWRWPQHCIHDLVGWARALTRDTGPAEVSSAGLALDYEAFVGRALPASADHRLRGTRLPLGKRAQVLGEAVKLAERHLAAGVLLSGAPLGRCRSLLPLGGRVCAGLSARPYFATRREVMLQLMRLAAHCRDSDRFLMD